jgi:hypothetical protein
LAYYQYVSNKLKERNSVSDKTILLETTVSGNVVVKLEEYVSDDVDPKEYVVTVSHPDPDQSSERSFGNKEKAQDWFNQQSSNYKKKRQVNQ